jgi:hypothetical protein
MIFSFTFIFDPKQQRHRLHSPNSIFRPDTIKLLVTNQSLYLNRTPTTSSASRLFPNCLPNFVVRFGRMLLRFHDLLIFGLTKSVADMAPISSPILMPVSQLRMRLVLANLQLCAIYRRKQDLLAWKAIALHLVGKLKNSSAEFHPTSRFPRRSMCIATATLSALCQHLLPMSMDGPPIYNIALKMPLWVNRCDEPLCR